MARILVAEDDGPLRKLLATLLSEQGHDVGVAVDGAEALRLATESRFDLLVTDYVMPLVDGVDLTLALNAPPPPVIVFSAYPADGKLLPLVRSHRVRYVSKGERVGTLMQCVQDLLAAA